MEATERRVCELTELLPDQCGCRQHRGGLTPDEQHAADREAWVSRVFLARFTGHCEVCDEPIRPGEQITLAGSGYGRGHYRHVDCEEE